MDLLTPLSCAMNSTLASIRIIGRAGDAAVMASEAARHAFPDALVTRTDELSELLTQPILPGAELIVLLTPTPSEVERAVTAVNTRGVPRWAVVACQAENGGGNNLSHLVRVTPEDWTEPMLRLAFDSAVRLQAMKAANAQMCGDLRTIGRRLGHDLRSPLNCIATTSEAMLEPDENPASPRSEFARTIAGSVDEVITLFERINFVMKATTNPPPRQPVIMEEIVWGALQRLESRILKAGVTIEKPAQWPIVEGVPAWFDVIWSNLLANSLDHAGPKARIEVGWEQLPEGYRFWLRDSGPGVPPKKENHLFYPLDRLSELNAPRGLGLSIVHRLVEAQGGQCGYEREPSGSGTFYFTLPTAPGAPPT